MLAIERILQRKDVPAVIVAIVVGLATVQFISAITGPITSELFGATLQAEASFKDTYLFPTGNFVLQVIALELLVRGVIAARGYAYPKKRK